MNSRQKIKAFKLVGVYDRRGKKYNGKPSVHFFPKHKSLRQITSRWYYSEKFLKKLRSGRKMKNKENSSYNRLTTMKSYTDLKQSRKLAEILPLETADMCYIKGKAHLGFLYEEYKEFGDSVLQEYEPCWSLAALLNVLPKIHMLKPLLDLEDCSIMYSGTEI